MSGRPENQQNGFTLLEVILVLALVGIIGTIAMFGLLNLTRSFTFVKGSGELAGKAQLAMLRLGKEFQLIKTATGSATALTYTGSRIGGDETHTLALSGNALLLDGVTLVDQVNDFSLTYYDTYDGAPSASWSGTSKIIGINLAVNGPEGTTPSFQTRITVRNIP